MAYFSNLEAIAASRRASSPEYEVTAFVISRLAELVVVLFNDRVGHDAAAMKDRAEGRAVMLALGDLAADHGRTDLMPMLHDLAAKIEAGHRMRDPKMQFEPPLQGTATLTYHF